MPQNRSTPEALAFFTELIGAERVAFIDENNWMSFERDETFVKGEQQWAIHFFEKDGKRDTIIYFSIYYDAVAKEFWTQNAIEVEFPRFPTWETMMAHYRTIEDEITDYEGYTTAELPD